MEFEHQVNIYWETIEYMGAFGLGSMSVVFLKENIALSLLWSSNIILTLKSSLGFYFLANRNTTSSCFSSWPIYLHSKVSIERIQVLIFRDSIELEKKLVILIWDYGIFEIMGSFLLTLWLLMINAVSGVMWLI